MDELSTRQREILELIRTKVAQRGYPPSVREIGEVLGLRSPSTVHSHLSALVRSGYLRRDPSKPRAIEIVESDTDHVERSPHRDVPLLGRIAAGSPILAEEQIDEIFTLPTEFTGSGPVFMLGVRGDSMEGAGILDGDYVVIRSQQDAANGEIVAALVDDDEATVKRFERQGDTVRLVPDNPSYQPMVFEDGVQIIGKVVAVLRAVR